MAIVEADALVKQFRGVKVVNNMNLTLDEGSITGFIGPNGAGKTTTIKMILGLLRPDSGKIRVFNQNPWDNPAIRSSIGVVYEKGFFPPHQKTREYLERTCRIFGQPENRAIEVLKYVELQDAQDKAIKALSAGMLQKFCIAHALINRPRLIIADEMTANLDPRARSSLFDLVVKLHREEGTTFFMSSHILPELNQVCDSIIILNRGIVLAQGHLNDIMKENNTHFVKVVTDRADVLSNELKNLPYVQSADFDARGIILTVNDSSLGNQVYEDTVRAAKIINAKLFGIETGNASIEELYGQIVEKKEKAYEQN
jgi:ABC-2 type transport system ATP-binding protein